jgi:hypothetical protein
MSDEKKILRWKTREFSNSFRIQKNNAVLKLKLSGFLNSISRVRHTV